LLTLPGVQLGQVMRVRQAENRKFFQGLKLEASPCNHGEIATLQQAFRFPPAWQLEKGVQPNDEDHTCIGRVGVLQALDGVDRVRFRLASRLDVGELEVRVRRDSQT